MAPKIKRIPLEKCRTSESLSTAIEKKMAVIEITDMLKDKFIENVKADTKENEDFLKIAYGVSIPETILIAILETASPWMAVVAWVFVATLLKKANLSNDIAINSYEFAAFEENGTSRFLLINKKAAKDGSIICDALEPFRFVLSDMKACPVCGKKIENLKGLKKREHNPYSCVECGQKFIWTVDLQQFAKKELKEEKTRQKELAKRGINEEYYSVPFDDELSGIVDKKKIASDENLKICKAFRQGLKENRYIPEPFINEQDGDFYTAVKSFFAAPFGTPDAEIAILHMVRFINIRTRQMRNAPMDRSEARDAKYVAQSYNLGMPVKFNGKYESALKEAAWFTVMSYLCDIFLSKKTMAAIIPTDSTLFAKWNGFIDAIPYAPQQIKDLFVLDNEGNCRFFEENAAL